MKDEKLNAVKDKFGFSSKDYKLAFSKIRKAVSVELILSSESRFSR
ncbi:hypothetical protein [Pseudovibrio denitrificans]|nr:hypothetical protein [Pseudovibrio denitrificans]